jgi:hypothetical protein
MKPLGNTLALVATVLATSAITKAQDPLPSWNDGKAKQSITEFVSKVTKEGSAVLFRLTSGSRPLTMTAHSGTSNRCIFNSSSHSIG